VNPHWNGQFSCFNLVAKTDEKVRTVVQVGELCIGGDQFVVMAGPCAVESEQQLITTAEAIAAAGARILRGGAFKPRSSPYSFQGLGLVGLKLLDKARRATGLAIVTEVMSPEDVGLIAEYADIMQVGTRSMQNYALLEALGKCGRPVLLKRGMTSTLEEVIAAVPVLKAVSHLPVIVDPSHAAGLRSLVPVLARAAVVVDADGLLVEVHPCPDKALSDGVQSLTFTDFQEMMDDLRPYIAMRSCARGVRPHLLSRVEVT